MKFTIGPTVVRQDPGGHEVTFSIQSTRDAAYHGALAEKGYRYTDLTSREEVLITVSSPGFGDQLNTALSTKLETSNFDLPAVPEVKTQPRVQVAGDVCLACEG